MWHLGSNTDEFYVYLYIYIDRFCSCFHNRITGSLPSEVFFFFCLDHCCLFFFKRENIKSQANNTQRSCCTVQPSSQVKYLQFVESIAQYRVHFRWPYDLQTTRETSSGQFYVCVFSCSKRLCAQRLCAYPGRYELHVWYPKSFPSHSSAPS